MWTCSLQTQTMYNNKKAMTHLHGLFTFTGNTFPSFSVYSW